MGNIMIFRFYRVVILLILALYSCSDNQPQQKKIRNYNNFELTAQFIPSFHTGFNLSISTINNCKILTIAPIGFEHECWCDFNTLSVYIPDEIFESYVNQITKLDLPQIQSDDGVSIDGISGCFTINNFCSMPKIIKFSNPKKTTKTYNLIELTLGIALKLLISEPYTSIVENSLSYFELGKGFSIIISNPVVVRFYNLNYALCFQDIDSILSAVDQGIPIIYDYSNLDLYRYDNYFSSKFYFNRKNAYILVANNLVQLRRMHHQDYMKDYCCNSSPEKIEEFLVQSGIDSNKIFHSIEDIIELIKPLREYDKRIGVPIVVPARKR